MFPKYNSFGPEHDLKLIGVFICYLVFIIYLIFFQVSVKASRGLKFDSNEHVIIYPNLF